MASLYSITSEGEVSLASGSKNHLILTGHANLYPKLVEWGISFDGVTPTDAPAIVDLYQVTITTLSGGSGLTEVDILQSGGTALCVGYKSATGGITLNSRIASYEVHPQAGSLVIQYPLGREPAISRFSATVGLAIVVNTSATVNATSYMMWEE